MNTTTIPAPSTTPAPAPGCPYECVRLGLGLRFHDALRLAWLVLATAALAMGCAVSTDPSEPAPAETPAPVICYAQEPRTAADPRANVHCVDPVTDIFTATCVSLADPSKAAPCSTVLSGLDCTAVDLDTWRCEAPAIQCEEWVADGEVNGPAFGELDTFHVSEGCALTAVGQAPCQGDITIERPAGTPAQIWHRSGLDSCAVTLVVGK